MPATRKLADPADPERLDILMPYSPSRAWAAVLALALIAGAIGAWAGLARVVTAVSLPGVLLAGPGPSAVLAPGAGSVTRLLVTSGSPVTRGQVIADLAGPGGRPVPVLAAAAGTVIATQAQLGDQVRPGTPIVTVDPAGAPLQAALFAGATAGLALHPGERVSVAYPGGVRAGIISAISLYPVGPGDLARMLGVSQVPGAPGGAVRLVTVRLAGARSFPGATLLPVTGTITLATQRAFDAIWHGGQP